MRQIDKKKGKDRVAAMIMLCFCLIALTSIFTIKASMDKISRSAGDLPVVQETETHAVENSEATPSPDQENEEKETEIEVEDNAVEDTATEIPTVDSEDSTPHTTAYLCPMDMEIATLAKDYSMDMVIYNSTLDQYMTHPGVDIEGPMNSGVKAIADGTVTEVYEDDAYGITIEITHEDGLISKYANLETSKLIEKGDTVSKGQHISNIGQSALYESMDKCHLHFELYQNGELIDPSTYIDFAS